LLAPELESGFRSRVVLGQKELPHLTLDL